MSDNRKIVDIESLKKDDIFYHHKDDGQIMAWDEKRVCQSSLKILVKDQILILDTQDDKGRQYNYTWHRDGQMYCNGIPINPRNLIKETICCESNNLEGNNY